MTAHPITASKAVSGLVVLALAGAALFAARSAAAAPDSASLRLPDAKLVWVDNESFEFGTCSAAGSEHVAAVLGTLRDRLMSDLGPMMLNNGVTPASQQFVTLTPVSGGQDCNTLASRVVFRVAGVSVRSGGVWSADVVAQTAGPTADSRQASVQLVNDLVHELDLTLSRSR